MICFCYLCEGNPHLAIVIMTDFLTQYHLLGLAVGIVSFLTIGLFHPVVIKCEYYFGTRCWWWFLVLGIIMCGLSVAVSDVLLSALFAVIGFSSFWTIKEIFEQRERVRKGWFPANPNRKQK